MMDVQINRLVRSRRKTVGLIIERDASLTVRAPASMPREEIELLVRRKRPWITRKQELARQRARMREQKCFVEGELHLYLGEPYPLVLAEGRPFVRFDGGRFLLAPSQAHRGRELLIGWYRKETRRLLSDRVSSFASGMGLTYRKLRVSGALQRWASCGSTGNLNFSWRLAMAPPAIIDYVVVHELAHRAHPNHSSSFWNMVEAVMPDYRKRRRWLREQGHLLAL